MELLNWILDLMKRGGTTDVQGADTELTPTPTPKKEMSDKEWRAKRMKYIKEGGTLSTNLTPEEIRVSAEVRKKLGLDDENPRKIQPRPTGDRQFDFSDAIINRPGFENTIIPQPPEDIRDAIWNQFAPTGEATPAALVAWSENATSNPNAMGANYDQNGNVLSTDYGIFQVNDQTMNGLLQRRPEEMRKIGVSTPEDLKDPVKNAAVAGLVRKDEEWSNVQPWSRWYGWQGKGASGDYLGKDINVPEVIKKTAERYGVK